MSERVRMGIQISVQLNVKVGVIEGVVANVFHCDRDCFECVGDDVENVSVLMMVLMRLPCD